jgi:hypothetical protein
MKEGGSGTNIWKPDKVPKPLEGEHDIVAEEPLTPDFNPFDEEYLKRKKGQSDYVEGKNAWYNT